MNEIKADLAELKTDVKELVRQAAIHNVLLQTHEARSLALQKAQELQAQKLEPIQKHVDFVNVLGKAALSILIGVAVYLITHALL